MNNDELEEVISLTDKLVSFQTTQDNTEELKECIDFIQSYFDDYDVHMKKYSFQDKPSLVVTSQDTMKPEVFLNGHIDVVPAEDYRLVRKDDKLVGRGVCDMKSQVASMMIAFKNNLDKNIGLMITSDEEVGGFNGVKKLLKEGWGCDLVVVPDGGEGMGSIVVEEKGVLQLKLEAKGESAHGSKPWLGDNAVEKLIENYNRMKAFFNNSEGAWSVTGSLNVIRGGEAVNRIPSYAEARVDIRYPAGVKGDELLEEIREAVDIKVAPLAEGVPFKVDEKNPYIKRMVSVLNDLGFDKVRFIRETGASDARFFSGQGIPVLMFKHCPSDSPHSDKEWVCVSELGKFHAALNRFLKTL